MSEVWPASLPQCLNVGYDSGLGENGKIESQPDTGPSNSRRRTNAVMRPLSGNMRMTRAQKNQLKQFFENTIMQGALPFEFPDPDDPEEVLLVKFPKGSQPSWRQIAGGKFMVSISLMIMP